MSNDLDDGPDTLVFEVLHFLLMEARALDNAVEKHLFYETDKTQDVAKLGEMDFHRGRSFYSELEYRIENRQITCAQAKSVLGLILREADYFRIAVQNLWGSANRDQKLIPRRTSVNLKLLLQEVVDLFEFSAEKRGIELRLNVETVEPILKLDRDLMYRVFANILDNAIKYSYETSGESARRFITIDCRRHSIYEDYVVLIQSFGVGIEQDEIIHGNIFEYGYRGRFAKDRERYGTGVGLAEAKRITEAHEGKIQVESIEKQGGIYLTSVKIILKDHAR